MKILIPTKLIHNAKNLLEDVGYEVIQDEKTSLEDLVVQHSNVDAMIVRSEKITKDILCKLPKLKLIIRAGAGFNTIDIHAARDLGIDVMNTPGANANAVAEEVIGMVLACKRHFIPADASIRQGLWEKAKFMGSELAGKSFGIAGFGHIGQLVAKRLKGFDNKILVFDPFISSDIIEEFGIELVSLEELFEKSDIISLHMPANKKTEKIINKKFFELMKEGSILVNCARYEIIDEDDLREVKNSKNIFYCNDVYSKDIAGDKSVKDIATITLPHLGASTLEANTTAAIRAANQIIDYFEKAVSSYIVNRFIPEGLSPEYQNLCATIAKLATAYHGDCQATYKIECSFYGNLGKYSNYLIPSVLSGISHDFDVTNKDYEEVKNLLSSKGIEFVNRCTNEDKNYTESVTIDLIQGKEAFSNVSIRGTIVENRVIISRINEFDKLYFDSQGINIIFIYQDEPGVIAKITQILSKESINIEDLRSPHSSNAEKSIAIIKLNQILDEGLIEKVSSAINAEKAFQVIL